VYTSPTERSPEQKLADLPQAARDAWLATLDDWTLSQIQAGAWWWTRRPKQTAPDGDWFVWLIMSGRGWGKMLGMDTPIPTPTGWKNLASITVGDEVFDEAGKPCRVTATFDGIAEPAYRVTFSDGTHLDACGEHQWVTWTHAERKAYLRSQHEPDTTRFPDNWPQWRARRLPARYLRRETVEQALSLHAGGMSVRKIAEQVGANEVPLARHIRAGRYIEREAASGTGATGPQIRTTGDLLATLTYGKRGDTNHCIPLAGSLDLPDADLPVDPYMLGAWLGDGDKGGAQITCADPGILDELAARGYTAKCYDPKERGGRGIQFGLPGRLRAELVAAGVMGDKHIPPAYLRASVQQRTDLLHGLMDTDGYLDADNGQAEFTNTNRAIIDGFVELVRSLGQKPVVSEGRATLYGVDHGLKWRVFFRPTMPVFSLARKLERQHPEGSQNLRNHHRMIVSIEPIEAQPMRCLTVDSPNSMFLAGEGMIPTHNTRVGAEWLVEQAIANPRDRTGYPTTWLVVGETFADTRDVNVEGNSGIQATLARLGYPYRDRAPKGGTTKCHTYVKNSPPTITLWPEGQKIVCQSADDADVGRGYNFAGAWLDELAKWGVIAEAAWKEGIMPSLRADIPGYAPQVAVTTTPKPLHLLRQWVSRARAGKPDVALTVGATYENVANLPPAFIRTLLAEYEGTRLGRQELHGELLDEVEGALWTHALIEAHRVKSAPELARKVIGVDPTGTGTGDEMGAVVVGATRDGHMYVLADQSRKVSGMASARHVWNMLIEHDADELIVEEDYAKTYLKDTLDVVYRDMQSEGKFPKYDRAPIRYVRAKAYGGAKNRRAEPVAMRYEVGRVHHVGILSGLEDQMATWDPSDPKAKSPDRVDALVYACLWLRDQEGRRTAVSSAGNNLTLPVTRLTPLG